MSASNQRWIKLLSSRLRGFIHETGDQNIQGGIPGEHYHISAEAYAALLDLIKYRVRPQPVMSRSGEVITLSDGDVVLVDEIYNSGIMPPDVVGPAIPPTPSLNDPYWNNVLYMSYCNPAVGASPTFNDQYNDGDFLSGTLGVGYATNKLFNGNTLYNATGGQFTSVAFDSYVGVTGGYIDNNTSFTLDAHVFVVTAERFDIKIGDMYGFAGRIHQIHAAMSTDISTMEFGILNSTGGTHPEPGFYNTFAKVLATGTWHHIAIQRDVDLLTLFVDGIAVSTLTWGGKMGWNKYIAANQVGMFRYTHNIARYSGNFIPPVRYYPRS